MTEDKYITKEYFVETLAKILDERFEKFEKRLDEKFDIKFEEKFKTKFKEFDANMRQYMKDLTSGYNEKVKGMGEYVMTIDDKVKVLNDRVDILYDSQDSIKMDILVLKDGASMVKRKIRSKKKLP